MDTISRENNNSYLWPVAGVLVGVIALAVACYAAVKASNANKAIAADAEEIAKIDNIESTANSATSTAQTALKNITSLQGQAQDGFNQIAGTLSAVQESVKKLQDEMTKPAPKAARVSKSVQAGEVSAPGTVSSDGTYTIKSGDSLAKIARANGISLADLKAANPEVDPKRLKVGQKINLPTKSQ
jgi:LysM repeat protein